MVDIPINKIPGVDPETFEKECVQGVNTNSTMPPLPPDTPPADAATTQPKLEQETTPHINTKDGFSEDTIDDDDTEDTPPKEIIHIDKDEDKEDEEEENINPPPPAEERTWNSPQIKL